MPGVVGIGGRTYMSRLIMIVVLCVLNGCEATRTMHNRVRVRATVVAISPRTSGSMWEVGVGV